MINYDGEKTIQSNVGLESSSGIRPRFRRCSGNSPGDHRKLAEGDRGLAGSSPKVIRSLLGVRWVLVEGDWELARNASRVCRKMIKSSSGVCRRMLGSSLGGFDLHSGKKIISGYWRALTKEDSESGRRKAATIWVCHGLAICSWEADSSGELFDQSLGKSNVLEVWPCIPLL
ncbi:hypothetical protein BHE74_00011277 [Ensete ventricosum]|nr:hypothetical protein BHE74_00011277 [Ensete ventricosum]